MSGNKNIINISPIDRMYRNSISNTLSDTSRYSRSIYIHEEDGTEYMETADRIVVPEYDDDYYYEVTSQTENRLDLVSYSFYGTPQLWWVIASASDIDDPLSVPIGTMLRIPDKSRLYSSIGGFPTWLT